MRMDVLKDVRAFQAMGKHELFVVQERDGEPFGDDGALVEDDRAGAELNDQLKVVCGDDLGDPDTGQQAG